MDKVVKEYQLYQRSNDCKNSDQNIDLYKIIKIWESSVVIITTWQSCHSHKVHREEYSVGTNNCNPEVNITQVLVHHSSKHLREPVIDPCKHSVKGRNTHYKVEVSNNEVCIVNVNIKCTVPKNNTCQTSGNES